MVIPSYNSSTIQNPELYFDECYITPPTRHIKMLPQLQLPPLKVGLDDIEILYIE